MKEFKYWLIVGIYIFIFYSIILQILYVYIPYIINTNTNSREGFNTDQYIKDNRGDFYNLGETISLNTLIGVIIAKLLLHALILPLAPLMAYKINKLRKKFVQENYPKSLSIFNNVITTINLEIESYQSKLRTIDISFNKISPFLNQNISQLQKDSNHLLTIFNDTNTLIDKIYENYNDVNIPELLNVNIMIFNSKIYLNTMYSSNIFNDLDMQIIRHEYFKNFNNPDYSDSNTTDINVSIVNFLKFVVFKIKNELSILHSKINDVLSQIKSYLNLSQTNDNINVLNDKLKSISVKMEILINIRISNINENIQYYMNLLYLKDLYNDGINVNLKIKDKFNNIKRDHDFYLGDLFSII
jgi:hypothetical protein